jgi:hypothetical protein
LGGLMHKKNGQKTPQNRPKNSFKIG